MRRNSAFTLVEMLTVVGVIAVLAAITLPIVAQARQAGKRAGQVSNMHQTSMGLALYAENNGGEPNWPTLPIARSALDASTTCDPLDDWRTGCAGVWDPLLGSFGYAIGDENDLRFFGGIYQRKGSATLLVSIFDAAGQPVTPFKGDRPDPDLLGNHDLNYHMPEFVTIARTDLSVARVSTERASLHHKDYMAWRMLISNVNLLHL